jgi:CRISPR type I-E-associated protein CasB/Cse2
LPFYLRREIHFLTNEGKRVNWANLLNDILRWQRSDRWVQRKWAKHYFATQAEAELTNTP